MGRMAVWAVTNGYTALLVAESLDWIEPRGPAGRVGPEQDAGDRGGGERQDHRADRDVGGYGRERPDQERDGAAHDHAHHAADQVSVAASTRNCHRMVCRVAPSALRTPISRVRS